jgi:Protein of unknown function (DUF3179)
MSLSDRTRWTLVLLVCLAVSLACVIYPIYVIRPFRAQGARELTAALAVFRFRPVITAVSALLAVWAAIAYWRAQSRWWRRTLVTLGAMLVCVLAALARVNVFELMFHPVDHPAFAAAADVKLDKDDKLIVVKIGASARAYPILIMAYHHVVNDVVGGTAIAATY